MRVLVVQDPDDFAFVPVPGDGPAPAPSVTPGEAAERLEAAVPPYHAAVISVSPGGEGLDLLRRVRRKAPATALVAVLRGDEGTLSVRALAAGADGLLPARGIGPRRLADAAREAVRRYGTVRALRARPLRVLHVPGTGESSEPLRLHLREAAPGMRIAPAGTDGREQAWDVMLLDRRAWGVDALQALREAGERPVVVVVDPGEEEAGAQALRLGAAGLIVRAPGWLHQVPGALEHAWERSALAGARDREGLLRHVVDSLSTRVMVLDAAGSVIYASRSWRAMAARCGTPICCAGPGTDYLAACRHAGIGDADAGRAGRGIQAVLEGREARFEMEYACHDPGGEQWFLLQATPMPPERGGVVVCHVNVTERRRMEEALRESHARYALATSAGAVGVWDWNLESGELVVDPVLKGLLGYADHEISNRVGDWAAHAHPDDIARGLRETREHLEGRTPWLEVEHRMMHRDGTVRWFLARGGAERREDGTAYRLLGTTMDATGRRTVEAELRRSRAELRRLAGRLLAGQEEERRRIARELHDDIIQRVAAMGIGITLLARARADEAAGCAARLHEEVERLAERIRGLSHRMHPAVLEHAGLVPALRAACDELRRVDGVHAELHAGDVGPVPPDVALALYRVAQEGLRNVARHSGARVARVTLARTAGVLELVITDRGAGFEPGAAGVPGLGLVSMAERVHLLGGTFTVSSAPGAGTELRTRLPVAAVEEGTEPARA